MPDARVAIAARPFDVADKLEIGESAEQIVEDHAHLEPSEVTAEAEVHAVTEGEVRIRVARHVERHGPREDTLVTIGGPLPEQHLVARPNGVAAQLRRARGRPALGG
jgi:hypothetical protein